MLTASAQSYTYDFSDLPAGNVGTDMTGVTAGQGDWFTFGSNGTAPTTTTNGTDSSVFQVVDGGAEHGNVIQVMGPNGDKGSLFMWKDGTGDWWADRTAGNDILEVEFDIQTGESSASRNTFGIYVYNAANQILAGAVVRASTKEMFLAAYSTPTGNPAGNYTYSLAAAPGIQVPANEWSRIGFAYDSAEGTVIIKGPGIDAEGLGVNSSAVDTVPVEIDIVSFAGSSATIPNAASGMMMLDNITVRASDTDSLLLGTDAPAVAAEFSVYPNPANNVINIANAQNILVTGVAIVDINGRTVKSAKFDGVSEAQINISDLSTGMYLMNISSDKGMTTKKIVKN